MSVAADIARNAKPPRRRSGGSCQQEVIRELSAKVRCMTNRRAMFGAVSILVPILWCGTLSMVFLSHIATHTAKSHRECGWAVGGWAFTLLGAGFVVGLSNAVIAFARGERVVWPRHIGLWINLLPSLLFIGMILNEFFHGRL